MEIVQTLTLEKDGFEKVPNSRRSGCLNFLRYFVIHTKWNLMSKRVCAVRR